MGRHHNIVARKQRRFVQRFDVERIETRREDPLAIECECQCRFVYQAPSGAIDDRGARLQHPDASFIEHVPGLRRERDMQADHVAAGEQLLVFAKADRQSCLGILVRPSDIVIDDIDVKTGKKARNLAPYRAETDDPDRLAG
ncbi:hypothetical protein GCM10007923_57430 [Shinella yambaruensis]|uniref:Uncharacterized protein n=1 Tax=Shinella yambaruensis TaxID=415996 RepID=A0ABQ5ZRX8_9HYPH|nr:hypothetical protein GCM10007923_57430 [Shinella yambaruensis]